MLTAMVVDVFFFFFFFFFFCTSSSLVPAGTIGSFPMMASKLDDQIHEIGQSHNCTHFSTWSKGTSSLGTKGEYIEQINVY